MENIKFKAVLFMLAIFTLAGISSEANETQLKYIQLTGGIITVGFVAYVLYKVITHNK